MTRASKPPPCTARAARRRIGIQVLAWCVHAYTALGLVAAAGIDFLTYAALPLLLLWRAQVLPAGQEGWLLVPLLASAYGFCQVSAKTDDGFFLGFPSYWNLVAFYLYALRPPDAVALGLLLGFAVLTFVPSRYLYP